MTDKSEAQRRAYIEGISDPAIRAREELAERMRKDPCLQAELEGRSNGHMIGGVLGFAAGLGVDAGLASLGGPIAFYAGNAVVGVVGGYAISKGDKSPIPKLPNVSNEVGFPILAGFSGTITGLNIPLAGAGLGASVGGDVGAHLARRKCEQERQENEDVSQLPAIPGAVLAGYNPIDVTKDHVIDAPGGAKPTAPAKGRTA